MLPLVPGHRRAINGARIWVRLGPVNFQPGEFAKIVARHLLRRYLVEKRELLGMAHVAALGPLHCPTRSTSGRAARVGLRRSW